ncbi:DUF4178 domain-containing protein [Cellulosimicrobium protaetiae]|uniref:DUF4178 domain-containing protein n=1 Tax=Cellulosimicrobium protaetiae TaxID=2587808 RepID=A0A6M5UBR6_9MICO|nr:DUF4178 domain-containing protein [Cellulosimicrobium protaetiae]QJW34982.1 DUF4178 domain-containing protein [Cellulosimicrobium protaetiae]
MSARPRLAMRVGEELVGAPPQRATPRAVAVLSTNQGGSTYTWEEWQLLAHDGSDVWVEYDHDTRDVTLYHPVEAWPPVVDMSSLQTGRTLGLRLDGRQYSLTVRERGTGRVEHVEGQFAEPFVVGQQVEYADLSAHGTVVSVERTTGPLGPVTAVYRGRRLDTAEQRRLFGRRLAPLAFPGGRFVAFAVAAVVLVGFFASCSARTATGDSSCTPRTVETVAPSGEVVTTEQSGTCVRRSVYGGGGGGLGK